MLAHARVAKQRCRMSEREHARTVDNASPGAPAAAHWPVIPGFEILAELGRGGMGVVYKARQVSLRRLVALKVIRDSNLASPQERARFRIEAEATARMRHPNVVQVYEAGEHQGRPYFAMELVEGGRLDEHLAGQPQLFSPTAALVRTLALAVQHAHVQNVIHRDLKPSNVLFALDPGADASRSALGLDSLTPLAKIADFGLAKRLDRDSTALTQDGAVMGSVSYMAPEQAAGWINAVGPAVDVYGLGAILYELLTGRPPFRGDSWHRTLDQVLHDEPVPPTRLRPDTPPALETVCLKCLDKEPGRRYASAAELADDLGRFLDSKSVAAVPLSERERLARLAAREGYQLNEEIGRGPRTIVYRGSHGPLQQAVAVKVFQRGICTQDEWEARLRRGAEMWAALSHPQIVPVQHAGWWDGAPYVATEYVPHGSLSTKIAEQHYPALRALALVEQLAEIVNYLHRQGVVHGNLKPGNVLFAGDGIPRLVDFRLTGGLFQCPLRTDNAAGVNVGYLAPELIPNPSAEPALSADVYGLGIILYELLAGQPPFADASAQETLERVRSQEPAPPSRFNSKLSPSLDAFCLRCLRKNPWRRYYRVYDLIKGLRHFQDDC
jgi:serine/threonine protein kinase